MHAKRVLVTGGAGFVGSHLCERLLNDGHQVICLDNLSTGSSENLQSFMEHSAFTFVERNVQEAFFAPVDWIFNLACPASPVHYQHDPVATIRTNVLGMITCLELAKSTGARVLQASTSEVYGDPLEHPQRETYWGNVNPLSRRACYDEGKRCAETLCFDYHREHGVDIRIIRIFNTYGPRMAKNDGRVISTFMLQALQGQDITIQGDGSHTRSFQYVDDLIEGMMRMMETEGFVGPVNLGNPEEYTILQLAERIIQLTDSHSQIVHTPEADHDPKRRRPDIALAKARLDWEPKIPLDEGLRKTMEYFRMRI